MNDKKFIQLLNLYIDGEATPVEAREVELAIESDPIRLRIYHDYCRIQTATRAMYAQFRGAEDGAMSEAGVAGRIRAAGVRSAAARPGRVPGHPFRRALFWAGGVAAACMAVAISFWSLPQFRGVPGAPLETAEAKGVSVPTLPTAAATPATAVAATSNSTYTAPFAGAMRDDPYLIGAGPAGDPFSLVSSRQDPFSPPDLVLNFAPTFAPVSDPARSPADAQSPRKLPAILRREGQGQNQNQQQGLIVPVNLRQQP